jgi:hypothetical protein
MSILSLTQPRLSLKDILLAQQLSPYLHRNLVHQPRHLRLSVGGNQLDNRTISRDGSMYKPLSQLKKLKKQARMRILSSAEAPASVSQPRRQER